MQHVNGNKPEPKPKIKHMSQLQTLQKARALEVVQHALLAIVAAQGKTVEIPKADLDRISSEFRLVVEGDGDKVRLTAQRVEAVILEARNG